MKKSSNTSIKKGFAKPILKKYVNLPLKKGKPVKLQVVAYNKKRVKKKTLVCYKTKLNQVNIIENLYQKNLLNSKSEKVKVYNGGVFKLVKKQNSFLKNLYLLFIGVFIGFVNGFWGGGGGMVCVPTLTKLLKLEDKKAHATTLLIMLPLSIASFTVYLCKGTINWGIAGFVIIGFVTGGVVGAVILRKINNTVLRIAFSFVIIAGAIKLLL